MTQTKKGPQKARRQRALSNDRLDQIQDLYIIEARIWFYAGLIAAGLTFLCFLGGLITWLMGIAAQGWVASVASTAPAFLSAVFFTRDKTAHDNIEKVRVSLEEQKVKERAKSDEEREEQLKKREQELAEEFRKHEQEQAETHAKHEQTMREDYLMEKLEAYYALAAKTDDEEQREAYYHDIFGMVEYNRRKVEVYFNTVSGLKSDDVKHTFFREMFSTLLKDEQVALASPI